MQIWLILGMESIDKKWRYDLEGFSALLAHREGNPLVTGGSHTQ